MWAAGSGGGRSLGVQASLTPGPPAAGEVDLLLGGGAETYHRPRLQEHDRAGGLGPALLGGRPGLPSTPHRNRLHPFMLLGLLPGLLLCPPTSPPSDLTATLGLPLHPPGSSTPWAAPCPRTPFGGSTQRQAVPPTWADGHQPTPPQQPRRYGWDHTEPSGQDGPHQDGPGLGDCDHPGGGGRLAIPGSGWLGPASCSPVPARLQRAGHPQSRHVVSDLEEATGHHHPTEKLPTCHEWSVRTSPPEEKTQRRARACGQCRSPGDRAAPSGEGVTAARRASCRGTC